MEMKKEETHGLYSTFCPTKNENKRNFSFKILKITISKKCVK